MADNKDKIFVFENDDDIKIAGDFTGEKVSYEDDSMTIARLRHMKQTGDLDSARAAGRAIAEEILGYKVMNRDGSPVGDDVVSQCRCVMSFAVVSACGSYTKSNLIERVIINEFYDTVRKSDEEFYEQCNDLAAMSSYYLDARKGLNLDEKIGLSFASLCHEPQNQRLIRLGNQIFRYCREMVHSQVSSRKLDIPED